MNNNTEDLQVLKNTSALGRLIIKSVPKSIAKEMIIAEFNLQMQQNSD